MSYIDQARRGTVNARAALRSLQDADLAAACDSPKVG